MTHYGQPGPLVSGLSQWLEAMMLAIHFIALGYGILPPKSASVVRWPSLPATAALSALQSHSLSLSLKSTVMRAP